MTRLVLLMMMLFALSGCASLSEQECLVGDWHGVGFEDGTKGRALSRIEKHAKACGAHGVQPDLTAYKMGRDQGLRHYCTGANGFGVGAKGGQYLGVCPEDLEPEFLAAFQDGRYLYDLEANLRSIEGDTYRVKERIDKLEHKLESIELELLDDATDRARRAQLLERSKDLSEEIGYLENELLDLYEARGAAAERLDAYRAELTRY